MDITILDPKQIIRHVAQCQIGTLIITDDVLEVLEELQNTDGYFTRILINDRSLADKLEACELASRSARGSYFGGPKLESFMKEHHDAIYDALAQSRQRAYPMKEAQ
jgi:hypothetical protein